MDMNQDKELKDLLQGHFAEYEAEPDRDIWAEVAAELGQKPRRAAIAWWQYGVGIAASILLIMGVIWLLQQPKTLPQQQMTEQPTPAAPLEQAPAPQPLTQSPVGDEEIPPQQQTAAANTPPTPQPQANDVSPQPTVQPVNPKQIAPAVEPERRPRLLAEVGRINVDGPGTDLDVEQPSKPLTAVARVPNRPQRVSARPLNRRIAGQRNELDLDELTLASAISFASDELGKWAKSPVEIYSDRTPEREIRTYELDILNLRITRKVYRKSK